MGDILLAIPTSQGNSMHVYRLEELDRKLKQYDWLWKVISGWRISLYRRFMGFGLQYLISLLVVMTWFLACSLTFYLTSQCFFSFIQNSL